MAVTIPPPHVPLASGSSNLLDALVPMPLPFLFLSPVSSLYGGLFHLFHTCRTPSTAEPFSAPPPRRASNAPFSVRVLLARDQFYFPVFFCFCL
jgi:hypothetical protein